MQFSTPETRASLILRLQDAADVAAWDTFESIYGPVVNRVALRHGLQPADAENVVQEVLLRVAKSIHGWLTRENRGPFRAWLLRIAHNEASRLLSRPATRPWTKQQEWTDEPQSERYSDELIAAELEREYQRELFQWAAEQVRAKVAKQTWLAFWLTHVEGLSVEDAATQLNVKPGNIYFGRSRVMHRLKLAVQNFGEDT